MPTDSRPRRLAAAIRAAALLLGAFCAAFSCQGPPSARTAKVRVPYLPQPPDQCGAAALAMVETFHGATPDMDAILAFVQIPVLSGTIPELLAEAARRDGFTADIRTLEPLEIHSMLLAGRPLILLLGPDPSEPEEPRGHFLVATGYDPRARALRAHTGTRKNVWLPAGAWLPRYRAAGSTAIILSPAVP